MNTCWLCGRNGTADPLDKHHIFGGAYRAKSQKLGLTVYLCHHDCHIFGPDAAHRNPETMQRLHEYGQRLAMEKFGWDEDDFRREFGKSYLTGIPSQSALLTAPPEGEPSGEMYADSFLGEGADAVIIGFALTADVLPY
jgi:hypothetical protein